MELFDFRPHLNTQFCVKVRKWLVKQEQFGITNQGSPHRNALALSTGQLPRAAVQQRLNLQLTCDFIKLALLGRCINAAYFHAKRNVLGNRHRRVERIGLEHHCDIAVFWTDMRHVLAVNMQASACDWLKSGNAVQQRGFTATRWSNKNEEVPWFNCDVDVFQDLGRPVVLKEALDF